MIIGISGKKRSGKDTVADILLGTNDNSIKYSFANPLKCEVARACGVTVEYIEEHKANFRLMLQGWGTDYRRKLFGEDYWLKKMDQAVEQFSGRPLVIIPDVRFMNEYDWVKKNDGIMVRVNRPELQVVDGHVSETELDDIPNWDIVICNDGTIKDLIEQTIYKIK